MSRAARIFYGPGDWLAGRTNVRQRRAVSAWLLIVWLGPGTGIFVAWHSALWLISFMSLFALWWTGLSSVGAETPVEVEVTTGGDDDAKD